MKWVLKIRDQLLKLGARTLKSLDLVLGGIGAFLIVWSVLILAGGAWALLTAGIFALAFSLVVET